MLLPDARPQHQEGLYQLGDGRRRRRAGKAKPGQAQPAVDQGVVQRAVHRNGQRRGEQRQAHLLHAAAGHACHIGKGTGQNAQGHDPQIFRPRPADGFFVGKNADEPVRQQQRRRGKQSGRRHTHPKADAIGPPDALFILRPPILGDEHRAAGAEAEGHHLDQHDALCADANGGSRHIAQPGHHGGVDQAAAGGEHILQGDGYGQRQHLPVKARAGLGSGSHKAPLPFV